MTNSECNVSASAHRWLWIRIIASIVDQLLDYSVVVTTILDEEYVLTAIQLGLIVLAGWKTSFFVGSSFGSKKPAVAEPARQAKTGNGEAEAEEEPAMVIDLEEGEDDIEDGTAVEELAGPVASGRTSTSSRELGSDAACPRAPGPKATGSSSAGPGCRGPPGAPGQKTTGSSAASSGARSARPGSSGRHAGAWKSESSQQQRAETSYLRTASIAAAKPMQAIVREAEKAKPTEAKRAKTPTGNPLNTVTMWGERSFLSIVMSPRELLKGIFEIEKFKAIWIIVTSDAEGGLESRSDAWGKLASGELARGLFMTIPQAYVQMYVLLTLWLGDCCSGRRVEIGGGESAGDLGPANLAAYLADMGKLILTTSSIISSLVSAAAACIIYEKLTLRGSGLQAPDFWRNPEEYQGASCIHKFPLGMTMFLSRAIEVSARTINVTFFLFFCSLSTATKIAIVVAGEFVFLFGFAVRKVILTRKWRRAQRARAAAEACKGEADGGEGDQAQASQTAAAQSFAVPSLRETARMLLQSVSITLPMYTTIHSQRMFEAAFGPGIPYPLFYGYRIGVQSICLHIGLMLCYGVHAGLPEFWTWLVPIMMIVLHILWLPLWRMAIEGVRRFARSVHGVGCDLLS